jgi:hypothetical protein
MKRIARAGTVVDLRDGRRYVVQYNLQRDDVDGIFLFGQMVVVKYADGGSSHGKEAFIPLEHARIET